MKSVLSGAACASGPKVARQDSGLLPECIVDQHFLARDRIRRSMAAVKAHPEKIGIGIDEGTALFVIRIESSDAGLDPRSYGDGGMSLWNRAEMDVRRIATKNERIGFSPRCGPSGPVA